MKKVCIIKVKLVKKCIMALLSTALVTTQVLSLVITTKAQESTSQKKIKNIIYMIPDGGGFPAYEIAKAVKEAGGMTAAYQSSGFNGTKITEENKHMYLTDYLAGSVSTASNNNETTDSAAAGTALSTGTKTNNGYIGVNANYKPEANILELAQLEGKSTGIIATSYEYDATPASFVSHTGNRGNYNEMIEQMKYSGINLVFGAGINYSEYTGGNQSDEIEKAGYTLVATENEMKNVAKNAKEDAKVWGTFHAKSHHFPYDYKYGSKYDGIDDTAKNTPTLAEMTENAIKILSKDKDGFFLMVEGSKVDYGGHRGKVQEIASEYIAFDEAFKSALEYAKKRTDTMIVVVADHNTGLNSAPKGSSLVSVVSAIQKGDNYADLNWAKGSGSKYPHTSADVGLFLYLPEGVERINGSSAEKISVKDAAHYKIDNTQIAPYLASLISDTTLKEATNRLYIDVTNKGTYRNGIFKFKEKNAEVKINTDQVTINNISESLNGELSLYINGKVYVSKQVLDKIGETVAVGDDKEIKGSGTKADPYIIANKENFLKFTQNMISGETYAGKYIKQTANIDMSHVSEYAGIGSNGTFSGIYDGQGHTISVNINASSEKGIALFPYTTGTIMNLGTKGSITNTYPSKGGCAGIVRSVRENGVVVNCYSTVNLSAAKDAGGIAWTVKTKGMIQNCYYKGKITTTNNYGIAWNNTGIVRNAYYQMIDGSTPFTSSNMSGTEKTSFQAATLNSNLEDAVNHISAITSTEELCKFADVEGYDFAFEGSLAKLVRFSYMYTRTDGKSMTKDVENFKPNVTGYNVSINEEINNTKPIVLTGIALNTNGNEEVVNFETHINEYGFATGEVRVTTKVANHYYTTEETCSYGINITAPISAGTAIPSPCITETPGVNVTPVSIKKVSCSKIGNQSYTGKEIVPSVTLEYEGTLLEAGKDYQLIYKNNKKIGKAAIVIKGIGNFKEQKQVTFKIVPKKTSITFAKHQNGKVRLKWKRVKGAAGYEIYRSTRKDSGYKKIGTVKSGTKVTYVDKKKLKKKKIYYYKIKAVKKAYKSAYSKVKSIKI